MRRRINGLDGVLIQNTKRSDQEARLMRNQHVALRLALLLSFISVLLLAQSTSAQSSAAGVQLKPPTVRLAGLHSTVTVRRDERGIPYIEAANEEDLYVAQGYVAASDRLWQMDLL